MDQFSDTLKQHFAADLGRVDYMNQRQEALDEINRWAAAATRGKINEAIAPDALDSFTRLVLVNAVYFQGDWAKQFDKDGTEEQPFFRSQDDQVEVPLMYQTEEFAYAHIDGLRILQMPCEGEELSMIILLPNDIDGLAALEDRLTLDLLNQWTAELEKNETASLDSQIQIRK